MDLTSDSLLDVHDIAGLTRLSVRTIWRFRSTGAIPPPIAVGGSTRWRKSDIDAWLAGGCPAMNACEPHAAK